jgi:hypothetical protein
LKFIFGQHKILKENSKFRKKFLSKFFFSGIKPILKFRMPQKLTS